MRVSLSLRSQFFRNACKPGFMVCHLCLDCSIGNVSADNLAKENVSGSIHLEEDATTVEAMLMEIYGVRNQYTDSVFTNFALLPGIKKEATMNTLLSLFVAADKVGRAVHPQSFPAIEWQN